MGSSLTDTLLFRLSTMSHRENPGTLRRELRFSQAAFSENLNALGLERDGVRPLEAAMMDPQGLLGLHGTELLLLEKVLGLHSEKPAVSLVGELISVKQVPAQTRVSYGYLAATDRKTKLGLVGIGFSDGLPRSATNFMKVAIGENVFQSLGRIAMDQCVVDLEGSHFEPGAEVVMFGNHYSLAALAKDSGFTPLEILGRINSRVTRTWSE